MARVTPAFLDTGVLLAGLIELGPASEHPQRILDAVAGGKIPRPLTAWHCCLEFLSVSTRLPEELRLEPEEALTLLEEEVLGRFQVLDLPRRARNGFLQAVRQDRIAGGRIYDVHIAEIARAGGAKVVVTDNRRHFLSLLRHDIQVLSSAEFRP